jgi:hypothetical protein
MKKIAANKNYRLLQQLLEQVAETKDYEKQLASNDRQSKARLADIEERLRSLEIEMVYVIRDLRNAIVAIEDIYQWREGLPDLDVLNRIWGSFKTNDEEPLN